MKMLSRIFAASLLAAALALAVSATALPANAQFSAPTSPAPSKAPVMHHAKGTFDVKIESAPADEKVKDSAISRMTIDKQFHGDLDGHSIGVMLATGSPEGSGAYVALERVTGTLNGRAGSFALQHSATMENKSPSLSISVVPGSGTGDLAGISGKMNIIITDGKHSYEFDYSLPAAAQ